MSTGGGTAFGFRPGESARKAGRKFSGSRRAVIHQRRGKVSSENGERKLRIILDRFSADVVKYDLIREAGCFKDSLLSI